ncbi:MAG: hypothetical protein ACRC5R_00435 [Mycoplasmatales bacterium]
MKKNILVLAILAITLTGCGYNTSSPQQIPENFVNNNNNNGNNNNNSNYRGMHRENKGIYDDDTKHYSHNGIYSVEVEFDNDNLQEYEFSVLGKDEVDMYEDQLELLEQFVTKNGYFPSPSEFNTYNLLVDDYDGLLYVYNDLYNKC